MDVTKENLATTLLLYHGVKRMYSLFDKHAATHTDSTR